MDGRIRVGGSPDELERLSKDSSVAKVARRDLPAALAAGDPGATTVSATLWAARAAGIEVIATGGIGGVHLGEHDVSADLVEMARTPATLVCSGPKSIVALPVPLNEVSSAPALINWRFYSGSKVVLVLRAVFRLLLRLRFMFVVPRCGLDVCRTAIK